MQEDDRYQLDMERLTRAEQRAEQLRSQLMDVQGKIADFESKLEQIEWALRPENIENSTAGYGSTRPEAARDARKKALESERSRVQAQLKLAENKPVAFGRSCIECGFGSRLVESEARTAPRADGCSACPDAAATKARELATNRHKNTKRNSESFSYQSSYCATLRTRVQSDGSPDA